MKYKNTNITITYSAKHTGTWFTIDVLGTSKEAKNVLGRSGGWIAKYDGGRNYENFPTTKIDKTWVQKILKNVPDKFFKNLTQLNMQAHHRNSNAFFYKAVKNKNLDLPIAIPIRDPLLAINTFFHREFNSKKDFLNSSLKGHMLVDNIRYISELCKLPKNNIIYFPIDRPDLKEKQVRIKQCLSLLKHFELTPTEKTIEIATSWKKSNSSQQYLENQKRKTCQFFKSMKKNIINKDYEKVDKYYHKAIELLKKDKALKNFYKSLGYKNLMWL